MCQKAAFSVSKLGPPKLEQDGLIFPEKLVFLAHTHSHTQVTFVLQSLIVQSKEDVMKRWEKSTVPTALWQLMPVTGPWWPSNIPKIPALLRRGTRVMSGGCDSGVLRYWCVCGPTCRVWMLCRLCPPRYPPRSCSRLLWETPCTSQPPVWICCTPAPWSPTHAWTAKTRECCRGNHVSRYHSSHLGLREHVQAPGAHPAIRRHSDQVVGVLGAHHIHTVHRVLH